MDADQAGPGEELGGILRRHRLAAGLTQEELAERSGLTARAVANMERGRTTRPFPRSVRALADALEMTGPDRSALERASRPESASVSPTAHPQSGQRDPVVPRQLPPAVRCFTGRGAELAELTSLLAPEPGGLAPALVLSAIGGMAGIGKTALAVQWAHQVASRFPDGQLYVNLRGYDPGQPVPAATALAGFLRALGVPGQQIPDDAEERASLYRTRLAGRRLLVLLDNARDSEQVRSLLPGDPACAAIVTSRDALAGLVAANGAVRLDLDALPAADAVALLRSLIGARVDAEPGAAMELAGLCARLPLALRIAAELAAGRPQDSLCQLAAELAAGRLNSLASGDERADVREVFCWSYRQLPDDAADAFALVGLHPGEDLDAYAAAALTGTTVDRARQVLGRLHRASLLQARGSGRNGMHDLLRVYAREQAAGHGTGAQRQQAMTRLFDYYLAAAAAAADVAFPAEGARQPRTAAPVAALPAMPSDADAGAWLDAERANLVAAVVHCAAHGWPRHAIDLARTLFRYLVGAGSHLPEALTIYSHALQAARECSDLGAEAFALNGLGSIAGSKGRFRDAIGHFQAARCRYRQCGNRAGEAGVLHNIGAAEHQLHNYGPAAGYYRQAIDAFRDSGNRLHAATALCGLGGVEAELGSHHEAADHLQLALQVFRDEENQLREAEALSRIGELSVRRGQLTQAAGAFEQSLIIARRINRRNGIADELFNLGDVSLRQGSYQQAIDYLRQALACFRGTGNQHGQTYTLRMLAEALGGAGQAAAARAQLESALRLADETGHTYEQASVHRDLAENYHRVGEQEQARDHWQQALDLYTQLGAPEAAALKPFPGQRLGGSDRA